ncbi:MAG: hypothetical protein ACI4EQ_10490 [Lachnospiraceae bacterium]
MKTAICTPASGGSGVQERENSHLYPGEWQRLGYRNGKCLKKPHYPGDCGVQEREIVICTPARSDYGAQEMKTAICTPARSRGRGTETKNVQKSPII